MIRTDFIHGAKITHFCLILFLLFMLLPGQCPAASGDLPHISTIADGWAKNSVNTVIFRHNSVITYRNIQYAAFYDEHANVVLARREHGSDQWETRTTPYRGDTLDAHNTISIMVDGDGFLHMAWNHHGSPLQYCRSVKPGSLELTPMMPMTGENEKNVTYPEFFKLPSGDLLFFYRNGTAGKGNVVLNSYSVQRQEWRQLHDRLIDGEGRRKAYWQADIDERGTVHLSWVWREGPDVATNHDLCYARSRDGGRTWQNSTGKQYLLPINAASAEYVLRIPQNCGLINQTSMGADSRGNPYIASYWQPAETRIPQYHLVYHDGNLWRTLQVSRRKSPFDLKGKGTLKIPFSRPQIAVYPAAAAEKIYMLFRDTERGDKVSVAICEVPPVNDCQIEDLTDFSVGHWEPTFDSELWSTAGIFNIFVQKVGQGDNEKTEIVPPQPVSILEWKPDSSEKR